MPASEIAKIGNNDFYRLETKFSFALYLHLKGLTYSKYIKDAEKSEDNVFFTQNIDRRNFYLFGNKKMINQVIDLRVEDMVMNPHFF